MLRVFITAVVVFLLGGAWYGVVFSELYLEELAAAGQTPASASFWQPIAEFARCVLLALALWRLIAWIRITRLLDAFALSLLLWVGFQAVAIAGSVIHEAYPWRLFALHAADALVKTTVAALLLTTMQKHKRPEASA